MDREHEQGAYFSQASRAGKNAGLAVSAAAAAVAADTPVEVGEIQVFKVKRKKKKAVEVGGS